MLQLKKGKSKSWRPDCFIFVGYFDLICPHFWRGSCRNFHLVEDNHLYLESWKLVAWPWVEFCFVLFFEGVPHKRFFLLCCELPQREEESKCRRKVSSEWKLLPGCRLWCVMDGSLNALFSFREPPFACLPEEPDTARDGRSRKTSLLFLGLLSFKAFPRRLSGPLCRRLWSETLVWGDTQEMLRPMRQRNKQTAARR